MKRRCHVVGMMLLTAAAAMCAQSAAEPRPPKATTKAPPPPRKELRPGGAPKSPGARNPDAPKGGGAQRLGNPGNPVERLMAMPPEKREQVLEKLPPQAAGQPPRAPRSLRQTARRGARAPEPDVEYLQ